MALACYVYCFGGGGESVIRRLYDELKRRNVFKAGIAYLITAWLLLQLTDVLTSILSLPAWVPRFIFLMLVVGFVLALIFAWAYELTPEGIRRERDVDRSKSITVQTGRKFNALIIGILAVAVVVLLIDKLLLTDSTPGARLPEIAAPSIAVLPFVAMTSNPNDEYFADGLTEELLNSLAQIKELSVVGRTSAFFYKGRPQDLREIGATLDVEHVLEGSVRRDGDRLRITAQLVRTDSGFHLWSDSYDRTLEDIFAIQEEIAEHVAAAMQVTILGDESAALAQHGTDNPEAHARFLIASAYVRAGQAFGLDPSAELDRLVTARRLLEEAITLDPDYGEAWATLVPVYYYLVGNRVLDDSGTMITLGEASELASGAVDKAVTLAPQSPETWAAVGVHENQLSRIRRTSEFSRTRAAFEKALTLDAENIAALELYAQFEMERGEFGQATSLLNRAIARDPLSIIRLRRAQALYNDGDSLRARRDYLEVRRLYPTAPVHRGLAEMEFDRGHMHHGLMLLGHEPAADQLSYAWASLGNLDRARTVAEYFRSLGGEFPELVDMTTALMQHDFAAVAAAEYPASGVSLLARWIAAIYMRDWQALMDLEPAISEAAQNAEPVGRLLKLVTTLDSDPPTNSPGRLVQLAFYRAYYAHALSQTSRSQDAENFWQDALRLADQIPETTPRRVQERHHARMLIFASRGDSEAALTEFAAMIDAGWRWLFSPGLWSRMVYGVEWGWFEDSPLLDSIRDEPRFIELLDKVKTDNARMLAELNAGETTVEDILREGVD